MFNTLDYAYGQPHAKGLIKSHPEDFCVEEKIGFELSGEGEHLYLYIEKKLLTTEEMIKILAKTFSLPPKNISYAGLKDKFAKTTQWFSLHLPGIQDPDLCNLESENHKVLKAVRHNKKLKVGALKENHFKIKINNFVYDEDELLTRIEKIKTQGVPNYFGPQRFGNQGSNLDRAKEVLLENKRIKNRHLSGIYYSAARAFLFNQIIGLRVKEATWNKPLDGDLFMLSGTQSVFSEERVNDEIAQRVIEQDISPAAALWGEGEERLTGPALDTQNKALAPWREWCEGLERHRLRKSYRPMIVIPKNFQFEDNTFSFVLPKGSFATIILRELLI